MTYRETVNLGETVLSMADIAEAKTDAWLLLEMVCKIDRSFYYLHMKFILFLSHYYQIQFPILYGRNGNHLWIYGLCQI